jgi:hypothetical protein
MYTDEMLDENRCSIDHTRRLRGPFGFAVFMSSITAHLGDAFDILENDLAAFYPHAALSELLQSHHPWLLDECERGIRHKDQLKDFHEAQATIAALSERNAYIALACARGLTQAFSVSD